MSVPLFPMGRRGVAGGFGQLSVRTPGIDQFHFGVVFPLDSAFRGDAWVISLGYQRAGF